jgi:hypothetical protein
MATPTAPSNSAIIDRLFGLIEKLIDQQGPSLNSRVTDLERRLAEIEAEWPLIQGENHAPD